MIKQLGTFKLYQALSVIEQLKKDDPDGKFKLLPVTRLDKNPITKQAYFRGMLEWEVVMEIS